jgi:hypothetical protein
MVVSENPDTDELRVFVASTLKAIAAGIAEAQDTKIASAHGTGVFGFNAPKDIEFDVAVSAKLTGKAGGGMKVAVFGIGANLGAEEGSENSTVSRIKFSVPTNFKDTTSKKLDLSEIGRGIA